MLWSLLKFLQGVIKDDGVNIVFMFNRFPTLSDYWYNGKAILSCLYQSGSFRFNILLQDVEQYQAICLKGPLLNLFSLDSSREMIISRGEPLYNYQFSDTIICA